MDNNDLLKSYLKILGENDMFNPLLMKRIVDNPDSFVFPAWVAHKQSTKLINGRFRPLDENWNV